MFIILDDEFTVGVARQAAEFEHHDYNLERWWHVYGTRRAAPESHHCGDATIHNSPKPRD
jgi:hypothetical protein